MDVVVVEWITLTCPADNNADLPRATGLAATVVEEIAGMIERHGIEDIDISIERPIYKRNAATYTKQIRLFQEIESGIFYALTGLVGQMYLTEVYPSTSKSLLTGSGNADKLEMVTAFEQVTGISLSNEPKDTRATVADAYAHALACRMEHAPDHKITRLNLTSLNGAVVFETGRGEQ